MDESKILLRIPKDLKLAILALAEKDERSLNQMISRLLRAAVKKEKGEGK